MRIENELEPGRYERAILRVSLADEVPASKLAWFLDAAYDLYFSFMWLDLAEKANKNDYPPDVYKPQHDEDCYINRLEIGSPNFMELIGYYPYLAPVFGALAIAIGVPYSISQVAEKIANIKKINAESEKIKVETELLKLQLQEKAIELYKQGKISENILKHKLEVAHKAEIYFELTKDIISNPDLIIVEKDKNA